MCRDCPTPRSRAKGVLRELVADLLIPFIIYAIPLTFLVAGGLVRL